MKRPPAGSREPTVSRPTTGVADGVSFDFGHVLVGLDLDELAGRFGPGRFDRAAVEQAMPAAYAAHDAVVAEGRGHEAGWRALMRTLVEAGDPHGPADDKVDALWRAQAARNLWRRVPPAVRLMLADLTARGVPMVITSNSEGHLEHLVRELDLFVHFRQVLDSGVLGIAKPDPAIFVRAAEVLEVPLGRMVHVGDSESADVVGALDAGAFAIRFDGFVPTAGARPTRADLRVDDHPTLLANLLRMVKR